MEIQSFLLVCLVGLAILAGLIVSCMLWMSPARRLRFHDKACLAVSFLPRVLLAGVYAWALYVRVGLGYSHWPCMCDMPQVNEFNAVPQGGTVFVLLFLAPVWLVWGLIRHHLGLRGYLGLSMWVFASGVIILVLLLALDPFRVWNWVVNYWA